MPFREEPKIFLPATIEAKQKYANNGIPAKICEITDRSKDEKKYFRYTPYAEQKRGLKPLDIP